MRFYSKTSNYKLVLKPGVQGNSALGIAPVNGKSVKFDGGVVVIPDTDKETLDMMKASPSYGLHFVSDEEEGKDPFALLRKDSEPVHIIQNMKHGSIESQQTSKPIMDQQQMIMQAAKIMAAEMVKSMVPEIAAKIREQATAPATAPATPPEPVAEASTPQPASRKKKTVPAEAPKE